MTHVVQGITLLAVSVSRMRQVLSLKARSVQSYSMFDGPVLCKHGCHFSEKEPGTVRPRDWPGTVGREQDCPADGARLTAFKISQFSNGVFAVLPASCVPFLVRNKSSTQLGSRCGQLWLNRRQRALQGPSTVNHQGVPGHMARLR